MTPDAHWSSHSTTTPLMFGDVEISCFNTKDPDYKVGQLVYMKRSGPGSKLAPVWVGPFRLTRQVTPVDWMMEGATGVSKIVHVNLLKPCTDPDSDLGILRGRGRPRKETTP